MVRLPPPAGVRRKPDFRQVRGILLMIGVGAGIGYLAGKFGAQLFPRPTGPLWLKLMPLAWVLPAWLAAVAWHEFGHLVGGWLTGGRFLLWIVGPFKVQRTPAGIKAGWNRSVNLGGGLAACLPLEPERMTPRRMAVMILGGPLFSLVMAVAGLWLAAWLGSRPETTAGRLMEQAVLAGTALSALIALATLFPGTAGGFKSDGRRVFDLLCGGPRADQEAAMLALTTAQLAGQRPADFDPALVARALALKDGSLFDVYSHLTVFAHAADSGDWAAAQSHLDHVLAHEEQVAPFVRDIARCEYAWLLAERTGDAAAARAWLESAGKLELDPATRLRAEAAVLLAEGRRTEAEAKARAGLHALEHRSLSPTINGFVEDGLKDLLTRAAAQ